MSISLIMGLALGLYEGGGAAAESGPLAITDDEGFCPTDDADFAPTEDE